MSTPEKRWIPTCFVDEVTPTPRAQADNWIAPTSSNGIAVVSDDDQELVASVSVGETMNFDWVIDFGEFDLTIHPDGTYDAGHFPAEATHFVTCGDPDTLAYSIDDFVKNMIDAEGPYEEPETISVACYRWCEEPVTFRLTERDGRPTFVEHMEANAHG